MADEMIVGELERRVKVGGETMQRVFRGLPVEKADLAEQNLRMDANL